MDALWEFTFAAWAVWPGILCLMVPLAKEIVVVAQTATLCGDSSLPFFF